MGADAAHLTVSKHLGQPYTCLQSLDALGATISTQNRKAGPPVTVLNWEQRVRMSRLTSGPNGNGSVETRRELPSLQV